jgi:hypothetical protein
LIALLFGLKAILLFDSLLPLLPGLKVVAFEEVVEVLDLFVDFAEVLSDGLVVLVAALDVLLAHDEEELGDGLVVPDHLAPA